jgi:type VII secretion protein EccB
VSSKRDLVEAHSFSRRRLVTAFVSGAPGGREVEPVRPGRMVVGGLALAVLLVAGAAVAGQISPRTPSDWLEPGVVLSKETGASYAVIEDQGMRPLVNPISGQLIFGPELRTSTVKQEEINKQDMGEPIGIYGAPDSLPTPDQLVGSGWTACTNGSGGIRFHVATEPQAAPAVDAAVVVKSGSRHYLIAPTSAGAVSLALPDDAGLRQRLTNEVGLQLARPVAVTAEWLRLFPTGPALVRDSFPVSGHGPAPYADDFGDPGLRVGTLVEFRGTTYLLGDEQAVQVSPFVAAAYRALVGGPEPTGISQLGGTIAPPEPLWPAQPVAPLSGELCTVMDAAPGRAAAFVLATDPSADASAARLGSKVEATVEPGRGAYVRVAGHLDAAGGQPVVIDAQGTRYRLGGPPQETPSLLGYGGYDPPTVPDAWVERFDCGPELSREAAVARPDPSSSCLDL